MFRDSRFVSILSLCLAMSVGGATAAFAADDSPGTNVVILDGTGRTISAPTSWNDNKPVLVKVRGTPADACLRLWLSYRWSETVGEPAPAFGGANDSVVNLPPDEPCQPSAEATFTIPRPRRAGVFLTYTLWHAKSRDSKLEALRAAVDKQLTGLGLTFMDDAAKMEAAIAAAVTASKAEAMGLSETIVTLTRTVGEFEADAKLFTGTSDPGGITQLATILRELRNARDALHQNERKRADQVKRQADLDAARAAYIAYQLAYTLRACEFDAHVLKVGGVVAANQTKSVYYDFGASPAPPGIRLTLLGDYPRLSQDDRLFAVVANRSLAAHKYPFVLAASRVVASPPMLEGVRPIFDVAKPIAPGDQRASLMWTQKSTPKCTEIPANAESLQTAYRDSVLPFQDRFVGNDVLTVSIATYVPQTTTDKKTTTIESGKTTVSSQTIVEGKSVDLLDKVKYPQVRALYRFNFATGAMLSQLKDPTFVRVKTAANVPDTQNIDEARYVTERREGQGRVFPGFLFSTYLKRVDIQDPVWSRCKGFRCPGPRMIPAPALGFSITAPADNVFAGVTTEIFENVHLFVGRHNGKVTYLIEPRDAQGGPITVENADRDSADPKTGTRREWEWSYGLTFNINVISNFLK